jgi:hypothetical protein
MAYSLLEEVRNAGGDCRAYINYHKTPGQTAIHTIFDDPIIAVKEKGEILRVFLAYGLDISLQSSRQGTFVRMVVQRQQEPGMTDILNILLGHISAQYPHDPEAAKREYLQLAGDCHGSGSSDIPR